MTYNVFGGTLNLALSICLSADLSFPRDSLFSSYIVCVYLSYCCEFGCEYHCNSCLQTLVTRMIRYVCSGTLNCTYSLLRNTHARGNKFMYAT